MLRLNADDTVFGAKGGCDKCVRARIFATSLSFVFLLLTTVASLAVNPDEVLDDPVLEARARALSTEIRCLVCQNQSIDDSDAQLARDLRTIVREQLVEGKSDAEILEYLVERYGEFVLLKPRLQAETLVLWFLPLVVFLVSVLALWRFFANRKTNLPLEANLSEDEEKRLQQLLVQEDNKF